MVLLHKPKVTLRGLTKRRHGMRMCWGGFDGLVLAQGPKQMVTLFFLVIDVVVGELETFNWLCALSAILCFAWDYAAAAAAVVRLTNSKNRALKSEPSFWTVVLIVGATSLSELLAHIHINRVSHPYTTRLIITDTIIIIIITVCLWVLHGQLSSFELKSILVEFAARGQISSSSEGREGLQ